MTRIVGSYSVRGLYSRSFLNGAASALDLRGDTRRQYRFAESTAAADCEAFADDWRAVGADFAEAKRAYAPNGRA